jgi:predicted O-methyltransferase YrrM
MGRGQTYISAIRRLVGRNGSLDAPNGTPAAAAGDPDPIATAIETLARTPVAEVQRRGWHFQPRHYYSALNDLEFLDANRDLWVGRPLGANIDWNLDGQLALLRELAAFAPELRDVPQQPQGSTTYYWENDFWRSMDAVVHYGILRHFKPRRIVEIGCGWSSLLMARALERNPGETAVHQIEPYPREELLAELPAHWTRDSVILQRAQLGPIEELGEGDLLFYDGSHVAHAASDVNWFFFEILPRVAPGVLVHLHDIFLPGDYPEPWIFERGQTWNEQYVLQAFLMHNDSFRPLVTNAALFNEHSAEVRELLEPSGEVIVAGGSAWILRTR